MHSLERTYTELLHLNCDERLYRLSRAMHDYFEGMALLETEDYDFSLDTFLQNGSAIAKVDDRLPALTDRQYAYDGKVTYDFRHTLLEVEWRGHTLHVLQFQYGDCDTRRSIVAAENMVVAEEFFSAVCRSGAYLDDALLIYRNGYWHRDDSLRKEIRACTLDALVLSKSMREALAENVLDFFAAKDSYAEVGVPWKRGVLMLGPPGNGKTHAIKALINASGRPCLYVRSLKSERKSQARSIGEVFQKARSVAPCMLVMEDLDSMIEPANLSILLNELDGFASNEGILTLATTNHPEKLDPALTERPSRFDRKIEFGLPSIALRRKFLRWRNEMRKEPMRLTEEEIAELAKSTRGFTFAYLKELDVSGTMAWMRNRERSFGDAMLDLVATLRKQIGKEPAAVEIDEDDDDYF